MKISALSFLAVAGLAIISGHASATTININREFVFESHDVLFFPARNETFITDTYLIDSTPVVLPIDSYDAINLTLSAGAGKLLVVDDVIANVSTSINLQWLKFSNPSTGIGQNPNSLQLTYTDGTGTLPADTQNFIGMASDGSWINSNMQLTDVSGAFAFNAMMIDTLIPEVNSGGTYSIHNNSSKLFFSYRVLGEVSDTGPFTHITSAVPVPAAVWLFGSGLIGLLGLAKRKRNCIR